MNNRSSLPSFVMTMLLAQATTGLAGCSGNAEVDAAADAVNDGNPTGTDARPDIVAPGDTATVGDASDQDSTADLDSSATDASMTGDSGIRSDVRPTSDGGIPRPSRPNIVVIMADDLDQGGFEWMLSNGRLPHIQNVIAAESVTFRNFFAANPLCCPSRATFLTGQYSHNTGVRINIGIDDPDHGGTTDPGPVDAGPITGGIDALDDTSTIATWLHAAHYRTGHVGKYLNGYGGATARTYVPPGWDDWQATIAGGTYRMYDYSINDNGTEIDYGHTPAEYQTDVLARRAAAFIATSHRDHPAQPMFLVVTPLAPHVEVGVTVTDPLYDFHDYGFVRVPPRYHDLLSTTTWTTPMPPSFDEADVSDKPAWIPNARLTDHEIRSFNALFRERMIALMGVDDLVGSVAAALRAAGQLENTVIIMVSDNGYLLGQHRTAAKQNPYEESIHVPLVIHVPGMTSSRTLQQFAVNTDLAPTIADLAGVTPGIVVDGRSLVPLLLGGTAPAWRHRVHIEHWPEPNGGAHNIPQYSGVRTAPDATDPNRAYVHYGTDEQELYSIAADPYEIASRHADSASASELARLRSSAQMLHTCAGASCRSLEDR